MAVVAARVAARKPVFMFVFQGQGIIYTEVVNVFETSFPRR